MQLQGFSACSEARFKGGAQESSRQAAQTQPLLRVTAKPDLATSLSGKAAEKIYTGLQQHGSKDGSSRDQNELSWLGFTNFVRKEFIYGQQGCNL